MPYVDSENNEVDKGQEAVDKRTFTFDSAGNATQTVVMSGLTTVTNIIGATTNNEGQVDEGNDEAVDFAQGTADNEVDITFYTAQSGPSIGSGTPASDRDVTVVAEGY